MDLVSLAVIVLPALAFLFYHKYVKPLYYWDSKGLANVKGWPVVGKQFEVMIRRISVAEWLRRSFQEFPDKRFNGNHQFNRPVIVLRDPEVIKLTFVKHADHFVNRINIVNKSIDQLFGSTLLFLNDQEWKDMRSNLSPVFTGSKIRGMFHLMQECSDQFCSYFLTKGGNTTAVDMKEVVTRFTNDVIASCAFGIQCNSLVDKKSQFYAMGQEVGDFGFLRLMKIVGFSNFPKVMKFFGITVFSNKLTDFFTNTVLSTIKYREANAIVRPDMIHMLMEAKKGNLTSTDEDGNVGYATVKDYKMGKQTKITDEDIVAQAVLFFIAGFENGATVMSFMAYQLAINPDIHDRLKEEVLETLKACNGKLSYEDVLKMNYLDMVVSETLRMFPAVPQINRICAKSFVIPAERPGEKDFTVEEGMTLFVPVYGLHNSEQYYPEPEKFDPERFNETRRQDIVNYSYLPFGAGPRNCIGSRFALLEIKIFFVNLMKYFDIVAVEKTPVPLKLTTKQMFLHPEGGFWVGFKRRE